MRFQVNRKSRVNWIRSELIDANERLFFCRILQTISMDILLTIRRVRDKASTKREKDPFLLAGMAVLKRCLLVVNVFVCRYYVQLGGASQNVEYFTDEWGYHPLVEYSSVSDHSQASASFALGEKAVEALKNNRVSD